MHPVHTCPPPCFPEIHSNIILASTLRSYEWSLPFLIANTLKYFSVRSEGIVPFRNCNTEVMFENYSEFIMTASASQ
jgi:hypothetical protein